MTQRTKEIGIRVALGAESSAVLMLLIRGFRWPVLCGLVVGGGLGAAAGIVMQQMPFGIRPLDPVSYLAAAIVLLVVAAAAALAPARRALRIEPLVALRHE